MFDPSVNIIYIIRALGFGYDGIDSISVSGYVDDSDP